MFGRRHGGELLHVVSHAGRDSRRVGGGRRCMDSRGGIHEEFGCGMRADLGEYRAQSGFETRTDARARIEAPRLACRRHAAQCDWLRAGQRVRLLRLWLSYRSETILGEDLACGRASARREVRRRVSRGTATGVEAWSKKGHRVVVKCKQVVVACGAIHTAALLLRSELENQHIGRHLHLHPVSNVSGIFEEEILPWEGTMQAIYSDQHRYLTRNYGVKYETTSLQPVIAMAVMSWCGRDSGKRRRAQNLFAACKTLFVRARKERIDRDVC